MTKIWIGTEVLRTKAATAHIKKNIRFLQTQLNRIAPSYSTSDPLQKFYSQKLEVQRTLLAWLQNVSQ